MKFEIGDKVQTPYGIGKVLYIDNIDEHFFYLVGGIKRYNGYKDIKRYDGHNGNSRLTKEEIQEYVIDKGYENQCEWFYENELELIEKKDEMKYKIGDKVKTPFGIGEILYIYYDFYDGYLIGIKGHDGYSGEAFLTEKELQKYVFDKGYGNRCEWFYKNDLELIEEDK